jgi:predicted O-methyltransferase YrrM
MVFFLRQAAIVAKRAKMAMHGRASEASGAPPMLGGTWNFLAAIGTTPPLFAGRTMAEPTEPGTSDEAGANAAEAPRIVRTSHENGHFYSPVVDPEELLAQQDRLWPLRPNVAGIDFNDAEHEHFLRDIFPRLLGEYDYPERLPDDDELVAFFTQNSQFSWLDSRALFVMLRHLRPRRMLEIGSGYSTLLSADVNRRFLGAGMEITCVEPFPRKFLKNAAIGIGRLIEDKVQNVPIEVFEQLQAGDVLFVDSSHVAKTGSDVNFIYFDVLPRLKPGVVVHIHDVFLPHEYLKDWVLVENRSWNEQYVLRALLMFSTKFRVKFGCSYAFYRFPELVKSALALPQGHAFGGGSLWIETLAG